MLHSRRSCRSPRVLVDGRVVKRDGELQGVDLGAIRTQVEKTIDHLRSVMGEAWQAGRRLAVRQVGPTLARP